MTDETAATRMIDEGGRGPVRCVRACRLEIRARDRAPIVVRLASLRAVLGSASGNDVCIADDTVSRLHAELTADDHGFRLRDLGSRNGTFVDGRRVRDAYLGARARVRLGLTEIAFEVLDEEEERPLPKRDRLGALVGASAPMRELYALIQLAAQSDATVLVEGETGTGKEGVAHEIHVQGKRAAGPFVVLDCAAVPERLFESELFGHEKGAFTDAHAARAGRAEEADGGTLVLDEVGELPLALQPKLLRFLETRETRRLGGTRARTVDVRFVAATHRDLTSEVARGAFREDLYFRLAVLRAEVPPLRARAADLPLLVRELLTRALGDDAAEAERTALGIAPETWERLAAHPWPGNVRELRNYLERGLALGLDAPPLDAARAGAEGASTGEKLELEVRLDRPLLDQKREMVDAFERAYLTQQLARHDGRIGRAAAAAGIDRVYYRRLLDKLSR